MAGLVQCKHCDHLYHDKEKRVPPTMLSCRQKQQTNEQRATYMGTEWEHSCTWFLPRQARTVDPMIAANEHYAKLLQAKPAPAPTTPPAAATPTRSRAPEPAANSPFDLGARSASPPSAAVTSKPRDPFKLA